MAASGSQPGALPEEEYQEGSVMGSLALFFFAFLLGVLCRVDGRTELPISFKYRDDDHSMVWYGTMVVVLVGCRTIGAKKK